MFGRLRQSREFDRVRQEGRRWRGKFCALNAAPALSPLIPSPASSALPELPESPELAENVRSSTGIASNTAPTRIGYIASKSLGNAVNRNRARRLLREAVRHLKDDIPDGWDIVLIAQASIVAEPAQMQHVRDDLLWLLNKANIRKSPSTVIPKAPG